MPRKLPRHCKISSTLCLAKTWSIAPTRSTKDAFSGIGHASSAALSVGWWLNEKAVTGLSRSRLSKPRYAMSQKGGHDTRRPLIEALTTRRGIPAVNIGQAAGAVARQPLHRHLPLLASFTMKELFDVPRLAAACAFRFLRQPNRPIAPRPLANSGRAAGSGVDNSPGTRSAPSVVPNVSPKT